MAHQQQCQDARCYVCGVRGYHDLLVSCSKCSDLSIHQYCLGVVPGSVEPRNGVNWICDYCSDSVSTSNSADTLENNYEIVAVEEKPEPLLYKEPKPLCIIYTYEEQEEATEIMMGVVLIVTPCGEARILEDEPSTCVDKLDYETLARSISTQMASTKIISTDVAKTKINKRKSELEKLDIVGFRRSPRFKRRKILKKCRGVSVY